jgi:3-dehydroquinate dehydratase I
MTTVKTPHTHEDSETMKTKYSLCGCLVDVSAEQIVRFLDHPGIDLLEWRLDVFLQHHSLQETIDALRLLATSPRHPVIATNRPRREGGMFDGDEELRLDILKKAMEAGAEWIDIELHASRESLEWLSAASAGGTGSSRALISHHDFTGTPERPALRRLAEEMAQRGAKAIKIVTQAHQPEDNLRVLDLIPFGRRELGIDVIAFCMGSVGRWSRLASLMLGSPWTYVQLPSTSPAAPGQLTLDAMRNLLALGDWTPESTEGGHS